MDAYLKNGNTVVRANIVGRSNDGRILSTNDPTVKLAVKRKGVIHYFPKRDKCLCNITPMSFLKNEDTTRASLWIPRNPELKIGVTNFNGTGTNFTAAKKYTLTYDPGMPSIIVWYNQGSFFLTTKGRTGNVKVNNFTIYMRGRLKKSSRGFSLLRVFRTEAGRLEDKNIIIGANTDDKLSVFVTKSATAGDAHEVLYKDPSLNLNSSLINIGLSVKGQTYFIYLNGRIVKRGNIETDLNGVTSLGFGMGQAIQVNATSNGELYLCNFTMWDEALTEDEFYDFTRFNERLYGITVPLPTDKEVLKINRDTMVNRALPVVNGVTAEFKPRLLIDSDGDAASGNIVTDLFSKVYNGSPIPDRYYNIHNRFLHIPSVRPGTNTNNGNNGNGFRLKKDGVRYALDSDDAVSVVVGFKITGTVASGSCFIGLSPGDIVDSANATNNLLRLGLTDKEDKVFIGIYGDENYHDIPKSTVITIPKNEYVIMCLGIDELGNIKVSTYIHSTALKLTSVVGKIKSGKFKGCGLKDLLINFRTNWRTVNTSSSGTFDLDIHNLIVYNSYIDGLQFGRLCSDLLDISAIEPDTDKKLIYINNETLKTGKLDFENEYIAEFRPRFSEAPDTTLEDGNVAINPFEVIANVDEIRTTRYLNQSEGFLFLPRFRQEHTGSNKGQNGTAFKLVKDNMFVRLDTFDELTFAMSFDFRNRNDWCSLFGLRNIDSIRTGARYLRLEPGANAINMYCEESTQLNGNYIEDLREGKRYNYAITINKNGIIKLYRDGVLVKEAGRYVAGKFYGEGAIALAFNEWKQAKYAPTGGSASTDMKIYGLALYGRCLNDEEIKNLNDDMSKVFTPVIPEPSYDPHIPTAYKLLQKDMRGTTMPTFGNLSVEFMPRLKPVRPNTSGMDSPKPLLINTYDDEAGYGHVISTESPTDSAVRFLFSMKDRRGFGFRLMENGVFKPLDSYDGVTICVNRNIVNKPESVLLGFVTGDDGRLSSYLTLEQNKIVYNGGALAQHHDIISEIGQGRYGISIAPDGRVFVYFYGPGNGQLTRKECTKLPVPFKGCGIKGFIVCGCDNYLGNTPTPDGYGDVWFKGFTLDPQFLPKFMVEQRLNELNV